MDYKVKSIITISVVVLFMIFIAVMINNLNGEITGAAIGAQCKCAQDSDCNDNNQCTKDVCLYPEKCSTASCAHEVIEGCAQ